MNSSSTYQGDALDIMIYGESHSEAIGVYINGLPSDVKPDAAKTAAKMNDFVSFVRDQAGENTRFLLIAPPRIALTEQSFSEPYVSGGRDYAVIYREEGEKLAEYYEELAGYRQTLFADASKWELDFAFDGVHLSEQSHARFAAEMAEVLNKIGEE